MKNNDWVPASRDSRGSGDDRIIGADNLQDDEIRGDSAPFRMDERAAKGVVGLTRDRVEEIRRRMEDGTYVSKAMAEQVAKRLIARGEF